MSARLGPLCLLVACLFARGVLAQRPASADALLEAARTGDRARVVALLDGGVDVNATSRYGVSALGFAAERGHFEIVRLLVARQADVNLADSFYGSRAIDFALRGNRLEIALYLLEHGSQGAVSVLNTGIRRRDVAAVKAALATGQADARALANANTLAAQSGDATIAALLKSAAAATPAASRPIVPVSNTLLRSYEGRYQHAQTGATVSVAVDGTQLTLIADGQPTLRLQPTEERQFVSEDGPELGVTFAGRGGIIERLSVVRGSSSVRYEREGYGDATSAAPDPGAASRPGNPKGLPPPARLAPQPWPSFRGVNGSGVADGQGVVDDWDATTGRNIRWKTAVPGLATSSPIVWGNRVIVVSAASDEDKTFRTGLTGDITPIADLPTHTFRVSALDRATGTIAWQRDAFVGKPVTKRHFKSSQANASPVTDGRHIVALFGSIGLMVCYDMDGTLLWKKDVGAIESGWFLDPGVQWGHSSSPIIYKSSVILQADQHQGAFIAAFDVATGRELWRTSRADEVSTWATPAIISGPKGDELITNGTKVRGYDPATGALLWTLAPNSEVVIGTPVVHRDLAIVTAGYPPVRPVYAIRAGSRGDLSLPPGKSASDAVAWSHDRDGTYISSPLVYREQLYTLNNNGILTAYDANTGAQLFKARVGGGAAFSASPVAADGKLFMASEDGDVFVVEAGRQYVELGKRPMNEVIMASPAIADGLLIIRTLGHVWAIGR